MKNILPLIAIVFLAACGGGNQKTVEANEAQETATASAEAVNLDVDTAKSVVTWIGSKPTGKHNGTIAVNGGTISLKGDMIESASFTMDIPSLRMQDMNPDNEFYDKLYNHLMSDDFFLADSFPTATFELVKVEPFDSSAVSDKDQYETENAPATMTEFMVDQPTHLVTGNLTMRGTTKSITFPAKVNIYDGSVTAEAKFNIDRTDWGLMYQDEASVADKAKDKFIYNTVNVGFVVETESQPAS